MYLFPFIKRLAGTIETFFIINMFAKAESS